MSDQATRESTDQPAQVARRIAHRRAVEAAVWGMPIVSVEAMRRAFFRDAGAQYGDICYFSRPADWRFQTTTPNASSLYVYFNFNTAEGPVVVDVPGAVRAGLFGTMLDAWQAPLSDIGPEGQDKGWGGKYLICPPGHEDVPDGYFPVRSETYNGYALFRAIPASSSESDHARAVKLIKSLRTYRLADAGKPPPQKHIDIAGKAFNGIVSYDDTFFDALARMVNEEPVHERDMVAMSLLRSIGVVKDQPFRPNENARAALEEAVEEAHVSFMLATMKTQSYWPGSHWGLHGDVAVRTKFTFVEPDGYDLDARAMIYFFGFAPPRALGAATFYLSGMKDADSDDLQGAKTYRLRIPPNVPVNQYWSVTAYDLETAGFIRESRRLTVDSYNEALAKNADGSIDVRFGPTPQQGSEANWIFTAPGKRWFAMFRFYGPQKAVFDKSWVLPDIQAVS